MTNTAFDISGGHSGMMQTKQQILKLDHSEKALKIKQLVQAGL